MTKRIDPTLSLAVLAAGLFLAVSVAAQQSTQGNDTTTTTTTTTTTDVQRGGSSGGAATAGASSGTAGVRDWSKIDTNRDGLIQPEEMETWLQQNRASSSGGAAPR